MNNVPEAKIVKPNVPKEGLIGRYLFRCEGGKKVVEKKSVLWMLGVLCALIVLASLFRGEPTSSMPTKPVFELSDMVPTTYDFSTIDVTPKTVSKAAPTSTKRHFGGPVVLSRPPVPIPPSVAVKAALLVGGSDGPVRARILSDVKVAGETAIHSGSVLSGEAKTQEGRLYISFTDLHDGDSSKRSISAEAYELGNKVRGLSGSTLKNELLEFAGEAGTAFLGGLAEGLQDRRGEGGAVVEDSSAKNALLEGVSQAAMARSQKGLRSLKESSKMVIIPKGERFWVIFKDSGGSK